MWYVYGVGMWGVEEVVEVGGCGVSGVCMGVCVRGGGGGRGVDWKDSVQRCTSTCVWNGICPSRMQDVL